MDQVKIARSLSRYFNWELTLSILEYNQAPYILLRIDRGLKQTILLSKFINCRSENDVIRTILSDLDIFLHNFGSLDQRKIIDWIQPNQELRSRIANPSLNYYTYEAYPLPLKETIYQRFYDLYTNQLRKLLSLMEADNFILLKEDDKLFRELKKWSYTVIEPPYVKSVYQCK